MKDAQTIENEYMTPERALVHALIYIVFNEDANLSDTMEPTPFKEVRLDLAYCTLIASRNTPIHYGRLDGPRNDLYRVTVEGEGRGVTICTHQFQFQPSKQWMCL